MGNDITLVHMMLIYLDGFNGDLYAKLSMLTHNSTESTVQLYFIMKSIGNPNYLTHNKKIERDRQKIVNRIKQVTHNDPETLRRLTELTKLFVDGQLHYSKLKGMK